MPPRSEPVSFGEAAQAALDACVHCGFCLPACPTYRVLGDEADSPRGRLVLLKGLRTGELAPADPDVRRHLDLCLDCRACETVCPSGVRYGSVLEDARAAMGGEDLPWFVAHTLRLLGAGRWEPWRGPLRLLQGLGLMPWAARLVDAADGVGPLARCSARRVLPERWEPEGERAGEVTLHLGCVLDLLFAQVNWACAALLRLCGYAVRSPKAQGCCGALHLHVGRRQEARLLARRLIDQLDGDGPVVVSAAGCGSAMRAYGDLLADDPQYAARAEAFGRRVVDVTELLARRLPAPPRQLTLTATYDDPCHLLHAQGVSAAPRQVLRRLGVSLRELSDASVCCGSAGVYNLLHREVAHELLAAKMGAVAETGAQVLVTANPGCQLQLAHGVARRGWPVRVVHVVELAALAFDLMPPAEMGVRAWL